MNCYFQGCSDRGTTKEHIPPKAFFPNDQRRQLITVRSCPLHNAEKSQDDLYAMAQIVIGASPSNQSREIFLKSVVPQLTFNNQAFRKILVQNSEIMDGGSVRYLVDISRFDRFFDALSCAIVFKAFGSSLPMNYKVNHIYHNLHDQKPSLIRNLFYKLLLWFYSGRNAETLEFGQVPTMNRSIYDVKIVGLDGYKDSLTLLHTFYGVFKVTSMLTRTRQ